MPIDMPESAKKVADRAKADVKRELSESNPFIKNHWLGAIITGMANRIYDFYLQLQSAVRDALPDTATGNSLYRWAAIYGKSLLAATKSTGNVVATGTAGASIPSGTTLTVEGVGNFITTGAATISNMIINIDDLTRTGATATAVTPSDHNLANGVSVTIAGASETEYNGTFTVTVTALNEFEFTVSGSPADEIGTSATASFTSALVPVESEDFGEDYNLAAGTELQLQSPIVNVDNALTVSFGEVAGGTDQETEESLRLRTLDRIQNPVALFNANAITEQAKTVNGVTRVFVEEITPAVGQVTVYFMRDNESPAIPSASEVTAVKNALLEIKPAHTDSADVIVAAPVAVSTDFTFTALSPNTDTMKEAIEANLAQFFKERTTVGVNVDEDAYRSAIFNTVDTATGDVLVSFTLSAPVGDITISSGEIATLGTVTI